MVYFLYYMSSGISLIPSNMSKAKTKVHIGAHDWGVSHFAYRTVSRPLTGANGVRITV